MDSFEVNKILGAILGTLTFTLALAIGSDILFSAHAPEKPGYELPSPAEDAGAAQGGAPAAAAAEPIATRLAVADPAKGEGITKQCLSCHSFEKGGPNKVGPNLHGIVGKQHAQTQGFGYSEALKAKSGEPWSFEALDKFLENPQAAVPKTAMNYPGLKKPDARANLIAWLNQNSDSPLPLPPPPAPGAAPAAPGAAEGAAPAAAPGSGDAGTGGPTSVPQPETGKAGSAPTPPSGAPEGGTPELPQGGAGNRAPVQAPATGNRTAPH